MLILSHVHRLRKRINSLQPSRQETNKGKLQVKAERRCSSAGTSACPSRHCDPLPGYVSFNAKGITLQHKVPAGLDRKETEIYRQLDPERLPRHIAIIMDGNGRWAKRRHMPRVAGHRAGVAAVRSTVETAARIGIHALTLYAFSE